MKYFCTVADKNFLSRVKALNSSLQKYSEDYKLFVLCIDDDMKFNHKNITEIYLSELLNKDSQLNNSRNYEPSEEALRNTSTIDDAKKLQFIWSLSSYFTNYCLNLNDVKSDLLYIDADIYFFDTWKEIYKASDFCDIGLVEHRMPWTGDSGKYNVGILYFKKNHNGIECSKFWKDCLLDNKNPYAREYGKCGDQKYLELFPRFFNNVISLDDFIGHLAPWNLRFHEYTDKQILWNSKIQNITYYHFSNFNFDDKSFIPGKRHGILDVSSVPLVQSLHEHYHKVLLSYA